jgi:hypothetical protein
MDAIVHPSGRRSEGGDFMGGLDALRCPRCAKNDQLCRVAATANPGIVSRPSEFSTVGASSGLYVPVTAYAELARILRIPAAPQPSTSPVAESAVGCGATIGLTIILWIIFAVSNAPNSWVGPFLAIMFFGWVAWVIFVTIRHFNEKSQAAKPAQPWMPTERIWSELYYCFRDDIVFRDDEPSKYVSASEMIGLLVNSSTQVSSNKSVGREEMSRMESNSERKGEASEAMRAFRRELFTQMAEVQEEQARTAADPKDREEHERLAQASRKAARDWE